MDSLQAVSKLATISKKQYPVAAFGKVILQLKYTEQNTTERIVNKVTSQHEVNTTF